MKNTEPLDGRPISPPHPAQAGRTPQDEGPPGRAFLLNPAKGGTPGHSSSIPEMSTAGCPAEWPGVYHMEISFFPHPGKIPLKKNHKNYFFVHFLPQKARLYVKKKTARKLNLASGHLTKIKLSLPARKGSKIL